MSIVRFLEINENLANDDVPLVPNAVMLKVSFPIKVEDCLLSRLEGLIIDTTAASISGLSNEI